MPHAFTGVVNQLIEVDVTATVAGQVGVPGATYLAIVAYTTPTTGTDHVVGLRFTYDPAPQAMVPGNCPAGQVLVGFNVTGQLVCDSARYAP